MSDFSEKSDIYRDIYRPTSGSRARPHEGLSGFNAGTLTTTGGAVALNHALLASTVCGWFSTGARNDRDPFSSTCTVGHRAVFGVASLIVTRYWPMLPANRVALKLVTRR